MMQPVAGRLQREKRFWKLLAIAQFIVIILMVFNVKHYIGTVILQNDISSKRPVSNLSQLTGYIENLKKDKSPFNSEALELFQSQSNINLVREIGASWLQPPSELPYNITPDTTTDLSAVRRLHQVVLEQFGGKRNGFFIECGAFDGVSLSNTLHLEQEFNWTGLLIEADPNYFGRLMTRQRKAWAINACLSIKPYEEKVRMTRIKNEDALSQLSEFADNNFRQSPQAEEFVAQCFPLTSILAALGQTLNVDYFSLDVEGAELKILKAVPWDFVYIKVISLEANAQRIGPLKAFLATKNYEFLTNVNGPWINDHVFVHKQFIHDRFVA